MTAHRGNIGICDRLMLRGAGAGLGALVGALLLSFSAVAQQAQPQGQGGGAANPPAAETPDPTFRPGFLHALGAWLGNSKAAVDEQVRSTQETLGGLGSQANETAKDAFGAVRDAAGVIVGLPNARIVTGRERCPPAANGAPDCRPAADALCRGKGFGSGRGLEVSSAQKCPAWVWLSGRMPGAGECSIETFVTRAVCQ